MVRIRIPVTTQAVDGSALCLECGLCCDGTLFEFVVLDDNEVEDARDIGLAWFDRSDVEGTHRWAIRQPCTRYEGGCCTVYDARPRACDTYNCRLLEQYVTGARSFSDCLSVVHVVRDATDRIKGGIEDARRGEPESPDALMANASFTILRMRYFADEPEPDA